VTDSDRIAALVVVAVALVAMMLVPVFRAKVRQWAVETPLRAVTGRPLPNRALIARLEHELLPHYAANETWPLTRSPTGGIRRLCPVPDCKYDEAVAPLS
jgi:hypothetical protein